MHSPKIQRSGKHNTEVIPSNPISLEKPQQKSNESDEAFGDECDRGSNNYEKNQISEIFQGKNTELNWSFMIKDPIQVVLRALKAY